MLNYSITKLNVGTQLREIGLTSYELLPYYTTSNDKLLLVCYCDDEYGLSEGMEVYLFITLELDNANGLTTSVHEYNVKLPIAGVNNEKLLFTIIVDKYYSLTLSSLTEIVYDDEESETEWEFLFSDGHLFHESNTTDEDEEGSPIVIFLEYTTLYGVRNIIEVGCTYYSPYVLKVTYNDSMEELRSVIYDEEDETFIIGSLIVYRETPYFRNGDRLRICKDEPVCRIILPLTQNFATDTFIQYGLEENFVDDAIEEAINDITEMEKDVYIPVIYDSTEEAVEEVYSIVFNLHFRQHRGDEWSVTPTTSWNGVNEGELMGSDLPFFSFSDNDSQSDLITYLNFTNDDVRYQKNKLKKSFLRLLFYDSPTVGAQNLLAYSTIFMDSGSLFVKYARNIEEYPYCAITYDEGDNSPSWDEKELDGVRVDREPYGELIEDLTDDEIEEYRLSTRFVIEDRNNSSSSSEGFYLYLWKDNDNGVTPSDVYMRVEFNHAGYGRTIPFMLPYWNPETDNKTGIKAFKDIVEDWKDEETYYTARTYLKYAHIHLKYRYDKEEGRHIYYVDDETYGDDVHFENNKIVFNLYEARMA